MLAGEEVVKHTKFVVLVGLNLADLWLCTTHSFKLLTRVKMEKEADMAKFVLESVVRGCHTLQLSQECLYSRH